MKNKDLKTAKLELKQLLIEGIPETIKALKHFLPNNSAKYEEVLLLEARLNEENKKVLRGTISNEALQLAYNQIRAALLDLIGAIEEEDFNNKTTSKKSKSGAQQGELLYRIPSKMELEQEVKCIVRIAFDEDEIVKNLELNPNVQLRSLERISNLMQVLLMDPNGVPAFEIRTINEPEQIIFEEGYTEWTFYVKALKVGTFPLIIKVAVIELILNKERKREIVLEEAISVTTTAVPKEELEGFKKSNEAFVLGSTPSSASPSDKTIPTTSNNSPSKTGQTKRRFGQIGGIAAALLLAVIGYFQLKPNTNAANDKFADVEVLTPDKFESNDVEFTTELAALDIKRTPDRSDINILPSIGSSAVVVFPKTAKTTTERVVLVPKYFIFECTPTDFIETTEEILVKEEVTNGQSVRYEKINKKILIQPATTEYSCIEPNFKATEKKYLIESAYKQTTFHPPHYQSVVDTLIKGYTITDYAKPLTEEKEIQIDEPPVVYQLLEPIIGCRAENVRSCMTWMKKEIQPRQSTLKKVNVITGCPEGFQFDEQQKICSKEIYNPPVIQKKNKVIKYGYEEVEKIEAKYKTIQLKELINAGQCVQKEIPAQYKTITVQRIVDKTGIPSSKIKKTYKKVSVKKIKRKARCKKIPVDAQYELIQTVIFPDKTVTLPSNVPEEILVDIKKFEPQKIELLNYTPPKLEKIKQKKLIEKGGKKQKVKALANPTEDVIKQIQTKLSSSGHYKNAITGRLDAATWTALSYYQNENALPIGAIDKETLDKMGIKY